MTISIVVNLLYRRREKTADWEEKQGENILKCLLLRCSYSLIKTALRLKDKYQYVVTVFFFLRKSSPVFYCRCKFILMRRMASFNLAGESWKNICFTVGGKKATQEYDFLPESGCNSPQIKS